jgi:hypothetical protein
MVRISQKYITMTMPKYVLDGQQIYAGPVTHVDRHVDAEVETSWRLTLTPITWPLHHFRLYKMPWCYNLFVAEHFNGS